MADDLLLETPARVLNAALHEAHRIEFNASVFPVDSDNKSIALTEDEWNEHVKVLLCWDTGDEGMTKTAYRKQHKKFYEKVKVFKVTTILGDRPSFILKRKTVEKNGSETWRMVVHQEQVFDAISEAHLSAGHKKVGATNTRIHEKYHNITEAQVKIFRLSCPVCNEEQPRMAKLAGARNPIMTSSFRDRFQVDLIDKRSNAMPDWNGSEMKWIMVVKDHFIKLVYLRALMRKEAALVAQELSHIMGLLGYPLVFHTDNIGDEFGMLVLDMVRRWNPTCKTVRGRPRTPKRANQSVKACLRSLEQQERYNGNDAPNWTYLLGQTMAAVNGTTGYGRGNQAPYVKVFGLPFDTPLLGSLEQLRSATNVPELDNILQS